MDNPQSVFRIAFAVVLLKFALGGMTLFGHEIPIFTGSDFAMALAAVGGIHSVSKHIDNLAKKGKDEQSTD